MSESIKASFGAVVAIASIAAIAAWMMPADHEVKWGIRIGAPILAVVALVPILILQYRPDKVPDYLQERVAKYFNRDGFCFSFIATPLGGVAHLDAYFQNQYERPCIGRIGLRPAWGIFQKAANIEAVTYEIECGPGAFGFARVAIPVPAELQGKIVTFEVGASVNYPKGKGKRLRFSDGLFLRANANFGNNFATALTIAGAAAGAIVWTTPAKTRVLLPRGVAQEIAEDVSTETRTLWRLGDPPLAQIVEVRPV
jgi:hypothetical protein